jgi:hypothetical protein
MTLGVQTGFHDFEYQAGSEYATRNQIMYHWQKILLQASFLSWQHLHSMLLVIDGSDGRDTTRTSGSRLGVRLHRLEIPYLPENERSNSCSSSVMAWLVVLGRGLDEQDSDTGKWELESRYWTMLGM